MQKKILVVDDSEINREMLVEILKNDYVTETAADGEQAVERINELGEELAAILLDLQMPKMNGLAVLESMKKNGWIGRIPVLIISGENSVAVENKCFELGVSDFIHKPFAPALVKNRVKNAEELVGYKNQLEKKVEAQTETLRKQYKVLQMQAAKLKASNEKIIEILGTVVEYRNLESGEHIRRIKSFTRSLANQVMRDYPEYGLTEKSVDAIVRVSSLYDVGKITISDRILLKPGRLTPEEFEYVKSHTTRGYDMLNHIKGIWEDDSQKICSEICRHHHERYDGKGYPDGLKGEEIPISAQIVAVADVYDALVTERVYKDAFPKDKAFHMIINGECGMFSPKIMECFRKVRSEFEKTAEEMR